jgi:hypothetical protein
MEQIQRFLKLTNADRMIQQMPGQFEGAFSQGFKKSVSEIPNAAHQPGLQADIDSFEKQLFGIVREQLSYDRMKPELIKLYDEMSAAMPQIQKLTADWTNEMKRKYGGSGAR